MLLPCNLLLDLDLPSYKLSYLVDFTDILMYDVQCQVTGVVLVQLHTANGISVPQV